MQRRGEKIGGREGGGGVRKRREINGDEGGKQILRVKILRKKRAERGEGGEEGREVGKGLGD